MHKMGSGRDAGERMLIFGRALYFRAKDAGVFNRAG